MDTGTFLPQFYSGILLSTKKRPDCLGSTLEFGGTFWEVECLTAILHPRANAPRLAKSLHLYHLGNFHRKKKDLFWFCCCLFAFTFYGRSFFSLERETDTNISYSDFAQQGSTLRTRGFNNILTLTHCVCALPLQYQVGPSFAFGSHLQTDTSNLSFCYCFSCFVCWRRWEMEILFCMGLFGTGETPMRMKLRS